ncbi:MAG: ATP phosphoribosyltransferase regulatory subunit [Myxococcales bacterium]|nr:ATP phosphoribosyltransferase regulatory subunit [Myxococcales bacterium]MDD9965925.1 ATP phosphoribosyltransferase regulatory subunit [Myxococcales bacterium]
MTSERKAFSEYLTRAGTPLLTPKGMGDLLPPAAAARRELSHSLVHTFGLAGYEVVTPPLFEHAAVVEGGNESIDRRDLLRFVEPESGEVAVLRPDITPQVARMVATRLTDYEAPFRLCYEGRVFRRRRGRARKHQQMAQVGVECIGIETPAGDVEVMALASDACQSVGLANYRIELGEGSIIRTVLSEVPEEAREKATELVAMKDGAALDSLAIDSGVPERTRDHLRLLLEYCGDASILKQARKAFTWEAAQEALKNLAAIIHRLEQLNLPGQVGVDLSETRGLAYYTGVSFQVLADGPGEAICSGGRYDGLLGRFGRDYPATGFALDLANLQWALRAAGSPFSSSAPARLLVVGANELDRELLCRNVRRHGVGATPFKGRFGPRALAFANSWRYDAVLAHQPEGLVAIRVSDQSERPVKKIDANSVARLATWAQAKED